MARGHAVLPAGWQEALVAGPHEGRLNELTVRQREVLELLARGHSNEEIAEKLFVSVSTVKFHLRSIYERLGVHSRLAAARLLTREADRE